MRPIAILTDFSKVSTYAVETGIEWAKYFDRAPQVIHVDNSSDLISSLPDHETALREAWFKNIDTKKAEQFTEADVPPGVEFKLLHGGTVKALQAHFEQSPPWMTVLGAYGHGLMDRLLLGSVAEKVVAAAKSPVAVIRSERAKTPKTILIPTDLSPITEKSLSLALELARKEKANLRLLHVIPSDLKDYVVDYPYNYISHSYVKDLIESQRDIAIKYMEKIEQSLDKDPFDIAWEVLLTKESDVNKAITQYADDLDPDLVLLGAHQGNALYEFFIGSSTRSLLRELKQSVVVIK